MTVRYRSDLEEGFLLGRDRRAQDIAEAGDALAPFRTVRRIAPRLGKFRRFRDDLVQRVDGARSEVWEERWYRF
ncbi:hypothetical protein ABT269_35050 [Streptomyces viridosporus]|uniref:hypothetical protein n=1 Tax=Streptomyces viridosporus TaxID=67581 RepID=UPI0033325268